MAANVAMMIAAGRWGAQRGSWAGIRRRQAEWRRWLKLAVLPECLRTPVLCITWDHHGGQLLGVQLQLEGKSA